MKQQSMIFHHIVFFIFCVAMPVTIGITAFTFIINKEVLANAQSQMYQSVRQTAVAVNMEYENMACMASELVHDKDLMDASDVFKKALTVQNQYKSSSEIDKIIEKIFLVTNLKGSIYLILNNPQNTVYVNRNYQTLSMDNKDVARIVESVPDTVGKVQYVDAVYWERNVSNTRPVAIIAVKPPVDREYVTGIKTVAVAFFSSSLNDFLFASDYDGLRCVVGRNGRVLISSDQSLQDKPWNEEKVMLSRKSLILEENIELSGWRICYAIPKSSVTGKIKFIYISFMMLLALVIVFFILYNIYFFRAELRPLQKIINSMNIVAEGDFTVRLPDERIEEFKSLADSFNAMTAQLDLLTTQIKQEQKQRIKSEINALRFQLNPHFVCNTLNTIRMMSIMANNQSITRMTTAFMEIMDDNMRDDQTYNSLEHELKNIENYVYLMQVRYGSSFDYYCTVPKELMNYSVPSMILQPIIENSIIHGIRNFDNGGVIKVSASVVSTDSFAAGCGRQGSVLNIEVSDNGCGIADDVLEHIFENEGEGVKHGLNHIGIKAVYNRIKLLFGPPYTMKITSYPGEGTVVDMYVPLAEFADACTEAGHGADSDR